MKKREKIFIIFSIFVVSLVHFFAYRVWFFSSNILTQGDWMIVLPEHARELFSFPLIWKSYLFGTVDYTPPFYIFLLLEGILSHIGMSYAYIERILFMWPIALFTVPFSYLFIHKFINHKMGAFIGALIYAYNTYFLLIQSGQLTLMVAFTFAPLVLFFFARTLEEKKYFYAVVTGMIGFITSFYEFRIFYLITLIAFLYYLYYLFVLSGQRIGKAFTKSILRAVLPLFIIFLLNFYWILPLFFISGTYDGTVLNRGLFGKEFYSIGKAITLFHPFWTGGEYFPFINQPIHLYFFLFPLFAFIGLYVGRRNRSVLFWGVIALLGIVLTKQDNPPFPEIYVWLYQHFPGFSAFREASKFYFFIALGYSVLVGAFIRWMWQNWKTGKEEIGKYVLTGLIIACCLMNIKPLLTGDFRTLFIPRSIPVDYASLNQFIIKQDSFFRTLWVPVTSRWSTNTDIHPATDIAGNLTGNWKQFTSEAYPNLGAKYIDFFNHDTTSQLLNLSSIKYVIVPLEDKANDDNFYVYYFKTKREFNDELDSLPYLKKMYLPLKEVSVYENKAYRPHVYITELKESIKQEIPYQPVDFLQVDTNEYIIHLKHINGPVYLHFSDTYHPDWKLRLGDFHWFDVLFQKKYFLPDSYHEKNAANMNSFYLDSQRFCNEFTCKKNTDGTYTIDLTLYFKPQAYMNLALIISGTTFIAIISFLGFNGVYYIRRKYVH